MAHSKLIADHDPHDPSADELFKRAKRAIDPAREARERFGRIARGEEKGQKPR